MIMTLRRDRDLFHLIVVCSISVLIGIIYFTTVYFPVLEHRRQTAYQLAEAKQQLALWKKEEQRKVSIVEAVPYLQKIQEKRKIQFRSAEFSSLLSASSVSSGTVIIGESYRDRDDDNAKLIQVDAEGGYDGVRHLLDEIANYPYFVLVEKFHFRAKKEGGITARILLVAYQKDARAGHE